MSQTVARLLSAVALIASVVVPISLAGGAAQAACQPALKSLTVARPTVTGGTSTTGRVTLTCRTPHRLKVRLRTSAGVSAPTHLYVARGKASRAFTVTSSPTTSRSRGTITAQYQHRTRTRALTRLATPCYPAPSPVSVTLPPYVHAGSEGTGSVTLDCASLVALTVSLTSSASSATVPATVTVPAGRRTASFRLTTVLPATSAATYEATIRATLRGRSANGVTQVRPGLRALAITPSLDEDTVRLTLTLTGAATTATSASLAYDDNSALARIRQITVPAGSVTGSVTVAVRRPAWDQPATVTATLGGQQVSAATVISRYFTEGDSFVVDEPTLSPRGTAADLAGLLHVTLDHPAGPRGATVELSSSYSPSYATIPAGGTTAAVPLTIWDSSERPGYYPRYPADSRISGVVTVIDEGRWLSRREVSVLVHPGIAAVVVPNPVIAGRTATARVRLVGAPSQDETVLLAGAGLTVPHSMTVPAGATDATFPVAAETAGAGNVQATLRTSTTTSPRVSTGAAIADDCRPTSIGVPTDVYTRNDFYGPLSYDASVTLGCTTPTELLIPLRSADVDGYDPSLRLFVPAFVTVPAGANTGTFQFQVAGYGSCYYLRCMPALDSTITAGPSDLATTQVVTIKPGLWGMFGDPDRATGLYNLQIWMTGPAAPGTVATISTDDPDVLAYPSTIEIPEGARGVTVTPITSAIPPDGITVGVTVSIGPEVRHDVWRASSPNS